MKDITFNGETKWKLKIINKCRLYCQVFFIGDMMRKQGKVTLKWLNGEKRNSKHHLKFPPIQKPSEPAWSLWKAFIF